MARVGHVNANVAAPDRRDEVLAVLDTASARVVGITGPPGAGKSTTIAALVGGYRWLSVNYDKDNFLFDNVIHGPVIGATFIIK